MRSLIRPTLFMVARLGLVLSVVAWAVGQWRMSHSLGTGTHLVASAGVISVIHDADGWDVTGGDLSQPAYFGYVLRVDGSMPRPIRFWINRDRRSCRLEIRHWLVVTLFALFYGVLKWAYRKRPGRVQTESSDRQS